jgi:hypothetical protein
VKYELILGFEFIDRLTPGQAAMLAQLAADLLLKAGLDNVTTRYEPGVDRRSWTEILSEARQ